MSVVRLEITVPDDQAADVASELVTRYVGHQARPSYTAAHVDVRTDARATRDRVILRAAGDFLPEA